MNQTQTKLFNTILPFIPETVVMNAVAYRNPKSLQNTIENIFTQSVNKCKENYRHKPNMFDELEEIKDYLFDRIMTRILVK